MSRSCGYRVRVAKAKDAPTIVAQRRAMFEDIGVGAKYPLQPMSARFGPWVRKRLASGRYRGWFAVDADGEIAGGAGLWVMEWPPVPVDTTCRRGYILNVYTYPAHRRRGVARMLIKAILDYCAKRFITVTLHASDDGRALYESFGFTPTREMRLVRLPSARRLGRSGERSSKAAR